MPPRRLFLTAIILMALAAWYSSGEKIVPAMTIASAPATQIDVEKFLNTNPSPEEWAQEIIENNPTTKGYDLFKEQGFSPLKKLLGESDGCPDAEELAKHYLAAVGLYSSVGLSRNPEFFNRDLRIIDDAIIEKCGAATLFALKLMVLERFASEKLASHMRPYMQTQFEDLELWTPYAVSNMSDMLDYAPFIEELVMVLTHPKYEGSFDTGVIRLVRAFYARILEQALQRKRLPEIGLSASDIEALRDYADTISEKLSARMFKRTLPQQNIKDLEKIHTMHTNFDDRLLGWQVDLEDLEEQ